MEPPVFDRSVNPISTREGGKLCSPLYHCPSRIFSTSYGPVIRICVSVVHSGCKCGVFCVFNPPTLSLSVEAAWEMNFWWPRSLHDQRWVIKLRRLFCPSPRWSNAMIATYCIYQFTLGAIHKLRWPIFSILWPPSLPLCRLFTK